MGEMLTILLPALLLLIPVAAIYLQSRSRKSERYADDHSCPKCHHETGLNDTADRCDRSFDDGWGLTSCACTNDFHWRYRSTTGTRNYW